MHWKLWKSNVEDEYKVIKKWEKNWDLFHYTCNILLSKLNNNGINLNQILAQKGHDLESCILLFYMYM